MGDRDLAEILESDDEIPNYYDDDSEGPAYLDDHRFNADSTDSSIDRQYSDDDTSADDQEDCASPPATTEKLIGKFHSVSEKKTETRVPLASATATPCENTKEHIRDMKLIRKGILSKQDIFCLKCVADISAHSTVLWFINFLIQKDMQNNFNFLKSCLVNPKPSSIIFDQALTLEDDVSAKSHRYVVVSR